MSAAYYNEIHPPTAQWLRNLIAAGLIAPGYVDERSIELVTPEELAGYTQCHFFAGIGVWSYALRAAGWSDDRPVWTGSCPCQPFSQAGRALGHKDERHLWPTWFRLIRERRPGVVFGEQVASLDGLAWLDAVCTDLEAEAYAVGAIDTCAAGVGAPHIRQRLFFVADAGRDRARQHARELSRDEGEHAERSTDGDHAPIDRCAVGDVALAHERRRESGIRERRHETEAQPETGRTINGDRAPCDVANTGDDGSQGRLLRRPDPRGETVDGSARRDGAAFSMADTGREQRRQRRPHEPGSARDDAPERDEGTTLDQRCGAACVMGNAGLPRAARLRQHGGPSAGAGELRPRFGDASGTGDIPGPTNGFWRDAEWIPCIDGKSRAVEPGTFPLAYGAPARVVRLRAYGNAINAEVARTFIEAYLDHLADEATP